MVEILYDLKTLPHTPDKENYLDNLIFSSILKNSFKTSHIAPVSNPLSPQPQISLAYISRNSPILHE